MTTPSDTEIADRIATLLSEADIPLAVEVRNGVATLTGPVDSPELRRAAIDLARMGGARTIDDQMEFETIAPDSYIPGSLDDSHFSVDDREALADEQSDTEPDFMGDVGEDSGLFAESVEEAIPYFPPTDPVVEPSTDDRELRIVGGFQDTSMDEMATEPDAMPGEEPDVIATYRDRDDGDIEDDVARELGEDSLTIDLRLTVNVINGVVFLRGKVPSVEDAENAEAVAARVPGVAEVQDLTEVEE
ncbi:MAG TPA: BON domain-containing protein [Thermomicrobiaceae bacterium]|nr:BON domain-containing protein [Thermomicrobiaceae bacterium]